MTDYNVVVPACSVYLKTGAVTLLYRDAALPASSDLRDGEVDRLLAGGFVAAVEDAAVEDAPAPDASQVPPRGGPGSGSAAWAAYAAAHAVDVPEDASRDDIIAALDEAGVPTDAPAS